MKLFLILTVLANLFINGLAYYEECDLGLDLGFFGILKNEPVKDDYFGVLKELKAVGITNITVDDNKYMDAKLEKETIIISTKEGFKEFEYDEMSNSRFKLSFDFNIGCENGTTKITFQQPIIDTNNHDPFFNRKVYNYRFGMDVEAGFELTEILSILATDVDISTVKLDFSFEKPNNLLEFTEKRFSEPLAKTYKAGLITKKTLTKMSENFNIIVTDDGNPKKTGTATINLTID